MFRSASGASAPTKALVVLGTRPEAIKLAPLIHSLQEPASGFCARVCVTAQHREMLDQVLDVFRIVPNYDLNLMQPGQDLASLTARILASLQQILTSWRPDVVIVQGDTTTTMAAALAAFYAKIPVAHVEAGLRTGDLHSPFPEEMNRVVTTRLAALHFAPTEDAALNLLREGIPADRIAVTGNTGIDAVLHIRAELDAGRLQGCTALPLRADRKLILVTAHRRESFGEGLAQICLAIQLLARRPDVQIVFPVHPNPHVRSTVYRALSGSENILLLEPLSYVPFVDLMRRSWFILTDSGGVQEEAPSLGKPILVMREKTERPEAVAAGTSRLVGTSPARILAESQILLDDPEAYHRRSQTKNPFGDGTASRRIASLIRAFCTTYQPTAVAAGRS